MNNGRRLAASVEFTPRFSEVDSMNIVWHGSYSLYFEDAREAFGKKYGIGYLDIFAQGYYAPLIDLTFQYKKPLIYGMPCRVDIYYVPTMAAKIVFDYEVYCLTDNSLCTKGRSVQVFMDKNYELMWTNPQFYEQWQAKMGIVW